MRSPEAPEHLRMHDCGPFKGRVTMASCAANRAKPLVTDPLRPGVSEREASFRPPSCTDQCADYLKAATEGLDAWSLVKKRCKVDTQYDLADTLGTHQTKISQMLTKRPERMREYILRARPCEDGGWVTHNGAWPLGYQGCNPEGCEPGVILGYGDWPLPNVWLGTTIWDQDSADRAVPILLSTPAAKRFVSVEPMLGPVDVSPYLRGSYECALSCGYRGSASSRPEVRCEQCGFQDENTSEVWGDGDTEICPECGYTVNEPVCPECGTYMVQEHPDTQYLNWVICGGETGPGARPMHPDWPRALRDQCVAASVPYFFKQWGEWESFYDRDVDDPDWRDCPRCDVPTERYMNITGGFGFHGERVHAMRRIGSRRAGRELDGRTWEEVPND